MADQGAGSNSGQAAGGGRFVKFSHGSAQRIAKAVRIVEGGNRDQPPVEFEHPIHAGSPLRVATFTGSWATGTWKTVTLTGTTATASVYNWCNAVEGTGTRHVLFGRASGTNSVVEITMSNTCGLMIGGFDLTKIAGFGANEVQVLGHNTTGPCLQWYSVTTCVTAAI